LAPGSETTQDAITLEVAKSLARFKCPTQIRFVNTLPRSATGKIAKGRLREVYGQSIEQS